MNKQRKEQLKRIAGWLVLALAIITCIIGWNIRKRYVNSGLALPPFIYCESDIIINGNNTAIIPPIFTNSEPITLTEEIRNAVLTPNLEHIVVLDRNDNMYLTDFDQSNRKDISQNVNSILEVRDEGILYRDSKNRFYRYLFADDSVLSLGKCKDYQISKEGFTLSFADARGKVYVLTADSAEKKKIGTYSNTVDIVTVAKDGKTVVYGSNVTKMESVMFYDNGSLTKLCALAGMNNTLSSVWVKSYEGESGTSMAIIPCLVTDTRIFIKHPGKDVMAVELGEYPSAKTFYTSEGIFILDFFTDDIIWVNPGNGENQTILNEIKDYIVKGDQITYLNMNGDLYCAEIQDNTLLNQVLIDSEVSYFQCTPSGQNVYYYKNGDAGKTYYDLYVCKNPNSASDFTGNSASETDSASVKIDSAVLYDHEISLSFSTDEKTVYYYTNGEQYLDYLTDTPQNADSSKYYYNDHNILKRCTRGEEKPFLISYDAVPGSVSSGRMDGLIENSSFIFQRNSSGGYIWQYFDGTKASTISGPIDYDTIDTYAENPYVPSWRYNDEP